MRALAVSLGVAVAGMVLFEATMQPTGSDRAQLLAVFAALAGAGVLAAVLLPRASRRLHSLRLTIVLPALAALVLVGAGVVLAASLMFLSGHDLDLLVVVLFTSLALALVVAVSLVRPLVRDLDRIRAAEARAAAGDLTAATGVARRDEVGDVAAGLDDLIRRLALLEESRTRDEEARRHLLAAVGHDLRSPLAALQAAVEALADGVAPDPARYLVSMERDLSAMRSLVDDLFLLARLEAGEVVFEPETVDLAELADEAVDALHPTARTKQVALRLDAAGRVRATGGPVALGRVIRNLIDNAIRHAPSGSEVVVLVREGDGAGVTVLDDGPGFPPDFVADAFDAFSRADPARSRSTGGAGLGLAVAAELVKAHGGSIWAEPGPGGKVGFRLPAS